MGSNSDWTMPHSWSEARELKKKYDRRHEEGSDRITDILWGRKRPKPITEEYRSPYQDFVDLVDENCKKNSGKWFASNNRLDFFECNRCTRKTMIVEFRVDGQQKSDSVSFMQKFNVCPECAVGIKFHMQRYDEMLEKCLANDKFMEVVADTYEKIMESETAKPFVFAPEMNMFQREILGAPYMPRHSLASQRLGGKYGNWMTSSGEIITEI